MGNRTKLIKRIFLLFLVAIFTFSSLPLANIAAEQQQPLPVKEITEVQTPAFNTDESVGTSSPIEIIEERSATEKVFDNGDGSFTKKFFNEPVHINNDGKWEEVSTKLTKQDNKHIPENTDINVEFEDRMMNGEYIKFLDSDQTLTISLIKAVGESGEVSINTVSSEVRENEIWYKDVFPSIDLKNIVSNSSVKEDIVLHEYTGHHQFIFEINTTLNPSLKEEGSVEFKDKEGRVVFLLPKPFMMDSFIDPRLGEGAKSQDVSFSINKQEDNVYQLVVEANADWLKSPDRKYPIYIDPTVTKLPIKNFGEAYVTNAFPNSNFSGTKLMESDIGVLRVGYLSESTGNNWTYIKKDLSNLKGASITNATFWVNASWSYDTTRTPLHIGTVKAAWDPSTITWNNSPSVTYLSTAQMTRYEWASFNVTNVIQQWANNPSLNYGFALYTTTDSKKLEKVVCQF
ncbi:DNRLRE domain-containing protein [Bacillus tianshenii]|uniref:DNRLRE domain-containing protein n=1 Tax=Sutcliffiella tianshenii TaxID=1463404 RepID=UPI001CD2C9B6|nr:DNRLRE domain-containing protein [Bacillus tianshenii]MCA1321968.1 DNRLRE domain-containing protein [Bacillus tianshenii]